MPAISDLVRSEWHPLMIPAEGEDGRGCGKCSFICELLVSGHFPPLFLPLQPGLLKSGVNSWLVGD